MKEGALHLCLVYSMLVQYVCRKLATFRQALVIPSFFTSYYPINSSVSVFTPLAGALLFLWERKA